MPEQNKRKQKGIVITSEEQFEQIKLTELRDDFWIKRIFKFSLLCTAVLMLLSISILFIVQLIVNNEFRENILEIIQSNLPAIVVTGLSILGIYQATKKQ
ncbi:MAG: hypothetical protein ACOCXT_04445 [Candidatus Dojkabacteria bacterium]